MCTEITYYAALIIIFALTCDSVLSGNDVHVSIKNSLGDGRSLNVHCQSKDNDLGEQTVTDGNEFGWAFSPNAWGTTLFYCDVVGWGNDNAIFPFDAYSFGRDWHRCETQCFWLISSEGMYGLNGVTGFWEFMYFWPPPAG
ncbi:hypothetical protein IFM89_020164 [Coptis chinensis]|uniref:S-protein homolog n=1 Tax=Coptis chinensis TaxID=261450 RepID=A0A835H6D7_9MAGN|nr:hypothetical protein IFM89_020164 [Coptis chinensis]